MGLTQSHCVDLRDLPQASELLSLDFTVVRSDGRMQSGWKLETEEQHKCEQHKEQVWEPAAHATVEKNGEVRVFLCLKDELGFCRTCGWRPVGTFWPTAMLEAETAILQWSIHLDKSIEPLEAARAALPDAPRSYYEEHNCEDADAEADQKEHASDTSNSCKKCFACRRIKQRYEAALARVQRVKHSQQEAGEQLS